MKYRVGMVVAVIMMAGCVNGAGAAATDVDALRAERLAMHGFARTSYRFPHRNIGYLMGNTEMGSLCLPTGLGVRETWFAGYWQAPDRRRSLKAASLHSDRFHNAPESFRQALDIANGVLTTTARYADGAAYTARMFFSHANRSLMVVELKNTSAAEAVEVDLRLHTEGFTVTRDGDRRLAGVVKGAPYTRLAWAAQVNRPMMAGQPRVRLAPGETLVLRHAFAVHWDGDDIEARAAAALEPATSFDQLLAENAAAWQAQWVQTAVVTLPDDALEKLFYRSIYWMLCTSGSEKFLPGEVQFSNPCWHMHAFTYGGGGWPVYAYTYLGLPDHARRMLEWHYKPEAFKANSAWYMPDKKPHPTAWVFGHELSTEGHELAHVHHKPYHSQRHIQGFAAGFFQRYQAYYPDAGFEKDRLWPVLRGTAEFWRAVAFWDEAQGGYLLPKYMSVSENSVEHSVLDAVIAAKYCLMMAARYADTHQLEPERAAQWKDLNAKLIVPQDDEIYLQYPGLTREAMQKLAGGYFGYRSPIYLGFPCSELIPYLDAGKVGRTLDHAWELGDRGHNMITFIASWFALTDTFYGRGDHALQVMRRNLECMPEILAENHPDSGHRFNAYYLDSYAAYAIIPVKMMVQSYEDVIRTFPAVPSTWKDVAFYNVPAEKGIRVSGAMKDGKVVFAEYTKDGKRLLRVDDKAKVRIGRRWGRMKLRVEP